MAAQLRALPSHDDGEQESGEEQRQRDPAPGRGVVPGVARRVGGVGGLRADLDGIAHQGLDAIHVVAHARVVGGRDFGRQALPFADDLQRVAHHAHRAVEGEVRVRDGVVARRDVPAAAQVRAYDLPPAARAFERKRHRAHVQVEVRQPVDQLEQHDVEVRALRGGPVQRIAFGGAHGAHAGVALAQRRRARAAQAGVVAAHVGEVARGRVFGAVGEIVADVVGLLVAVIADHDEIGAIALVVFMQCDALADVDLGTARQGLRDRDELVAAFADRQAEFERQRRAIGQCVGFGIARGIDPHDLVAEVRAHDHVVEHSRARLPAGERPAGLGVDEHGLGADARFGQQRRQQQRLVLAVAEAARDDGFGRVGLVRILAHVQRGVADLAFDEGDRTHHRGARVLVVQAQVVHQLLRERAVAEVRPVHRQGPGDDVGPRARGRQVDAAPRVEARRHVVFGRNAVQAMRDEFDVAMPALLAFLARVIGGRRTRKQRRIGIEARTHAAIAQRRAEARAIAVEVRTPEHRIGAHGAEADIDDVAHAHVRHRDAQRVLAVEDARVQVFFAPQHLQLRIAAVIDALAVAPHVERVQLDALVIGLERDRHLPAFGERTRAVHARGEAAIPDRLRLRGVHLVVEQQVARAIARRRGIGRRGHRREMDPGGRGGERVRSRGEARARDQQASQQEDRERRAEVHAVRATRSAASASRPTISTNPGVARTRPSQARIAGYGSSDTPPCGATSV